MVTFEVLDMTCGHCVSTITKAVKAADPQAKIDIDLARHSVQIESGEDAAELSDAIKEAGYTPTRTASARQGDGNSRRSGCCG